MDFGKGICSEENRKSPGLGKSPWRVRPKSMGFNVVKETKRREGERVPFGPWGGIKGNQKSAFGRLEFGKKRELGVHWKEE